MSEQDDNLRDILGFDPKDNGDGSNESLKSFDDEVVSGKALRGMLENLRQTGNNHSAFLSLQSIAALNRYQPIVEDDETDPTSGSDYLWPSFVDFFYEGSSLIGYKHKSLVDKNPTKIEDSHLLDQELASYKALKKGNGLIVFGDKDTALSEESVKSISDQVFDLASKTRLLLGKQDEPFVVLLFKDEISADIHSDVDSRDADYITMPVQKWGSLDKVTQQKLVGKITFDLYERDALLKGSHSERKDLNTSSESLFLAGINGLRENYLRGEKRSGVYLGLLNMGLRGIFKSERLDADFYAGNAKSDLEEAGYDIDADFDLKERVFSNFNPKRLRQAFCNVVGLKVVNEGFPAYQQKIKTANADVPFLESVLLEEAYESFLSFLVDNYTDLRSLGSEIEAVTQENWSTEELCKRLGIDYQQAFGEWKEKTLVNDSDM